jgi:hypothetical protein
VRAEKRRGVSCETTSTNEGFPNGRSAADAAFNAFYNASWIRLKQSTAFLYEKEPVFSFTAVAGTTAFPAGNPAGWAFG